MSIIDFLIGCTKIDDTFVSIARNFRKDPLTLRFSCFSMNCILSIKPRKILLLVYPHCIAFMIPFHCTIFWYSYTRTYNYNVSQSIYLQKLAGLPFLNVSHYSFWINHALLHFVGGAMDWEKMTRTRIFAITIPVFHADDLKGLTTTNLTYSYTLIN